jgi:threonine aldolase
MENQNPRSLASDNHSGVHPLILASLSEVNKNHFHSYEGDPQTLELKSLVKNLFGDQFESYLAFNGTAANVLCLQHFIKPWNSIICTEDSHLNMDECGAPEKLIGCKLSLIRTKDGKLKPEDIEQKLIRRGDQHYSQAKMVSITQPTELGTVYSLDEIQKISEVCKKNNLFLHMDGARLSNAALFLNTDFKNLVQHVDALSFGGTKNGLMGGELVLIKSSSSDHAKDFKFERKQSMQLPSKTRFIAQQFLTYFKNDLWQEIATHALFMAQTLESKIKTIPEIKVLLPVQSNAVFCEIPKTWIKELKNEIFFYVWEEKRSVIRLMTSFDTTLEDLNLFVNKANQLSNHSFKKDQASHV